MTNRPINKDCHWICPEDTKVVEFVKNVNTIPKGSTAINVNRSIIDHMESTGMKRMYVNVSNLINVFPITSDEQKKKSKKIADCDCDNFYSTGNCEEETGRCEW